jgi:hypothetical protein
VRLPCGISRRTVVVSILFVELACGRIASETSPPDAGESAGTSSIADASDSNSPSDARGGAGGSGGSAGASRGTDAPPVQPDGGGRGGASSDVADAPVGADVASDSTPVSCPGIVGAGQALALTNSEYNHTVRDLLGDTSAPADAFIPNPIHFGFRANPVRGLSDVHLQQYAKAADQLAQAALARLDTLLPCSPMSGEDVCARQFIDGFGLRAFRRPLLAEEVNEFMAVFQTARTNGDFAQSIGAVIATTLKSPHFYQIQEGPPSSAVTLLDPYRLASRLSYFIYRSMPDQPLLDAAASGKLTTAADMASQARRMLADPKAHDGIVEFFAEWLSLDRLAELSKDPSLHPNFATLSGYMRTETSKFVESVFFGSGQWSALLQSAETWLNEPLAQLYEVPGITGLAFQKANLDGKVRGGILTQASFLSIGASPNQSSPTLRGQSVLEKLFCRPVPPPPPAQFPPLPPQMPGETNRERYERYTTEPACIACHSLIDRVGFGFEHYDAIGRYRLADNGKAVDSSGVLQGTDVDGPFLGVVELSSKVASSQEAQRCVARQSLRFALSRQETEADVCSIEHAANALRSSGDLRELVIALAASDAFRYARAATALLEAHESDARAGDADLRR